MAEASMIVSIRTAMFGAPGTAPPVAKVGAVAQILATPFPGANPKLVPRRSAAEFTDCPASVAALSQTGAPAPAVRVTTFVPPAFPSVSVAILSLERLEALPSRLNCAAFRVTFFAAPPKRPTTFVEVLSSVSAPFETRVVAKATDPDPEMTVLPWKAL